ncbi:hypothetical protein [Bradyrhizobium sp. 199]|uniref:hypothetical protein n=1 Tax=Bradyrhizobium sp. 199 TaxID=2782664 RepID=UPI001FF7AB24|nr:hypothetical protein [Bradyrhizobium sp. 199]MCK1359365.1 hypothetical protein [Bradyrhizobium sp. 199]
MEPALFEPELAASGAFLKQMWGTIALKLTALAFVCDGINVHLALVPFMAHPPCESTQPTIGLIEPSPAARAMIAG